MKQLLRLSALALFTLFGAVAITNLSPAQISAHDDNEEAEAAAVESTEEQSEDQGSEEQSNSPYSYTAQPGDSYTKIARKAVQTYGINNDVNLSQAQIVAAETFLTKAANSPNLNTGEAVSISEEAVQSAVDEAKDLDEEAQSRWEKYVQFVDFNTDNVGESR